MGVRTGNQDTKVNHHLSSCLSTLHHSPPATPLPEDTLQLPLTLLPTPHQEADGFHQLLEDLIPLRQPTLPELRNSWTGQQFPLAPDPLADGIQWRWENRHKRNFFYLFVKL